MCVVAQGHVFAMEISSGEEFYIACDNTGTPLAVFSNNGLLLKQVCVHSYWKLSSVYVQIIFMKLFHVSRSDHKYLFLCVGAIHSVW